MKQGAAETTRTTESVPTGHASLSMLTPDEWAHVIKMLDLSSQQANVVKLMLDGHQDKEIASLLGLTVPTVRTYLARVFDRVRVKSRVQLVVRVFTVARSHASAVAPQS